MKDKSKLIAIILVIVTIVVVVLTSVLKKDEKQTEKEINIVTNYSNFYTVDSCLYRTITYIATKDTESLLLILSDDYKKENKIDANNVLSLFSSVEEDSIFSSKKMYYEVINSNLNKYYVYGQLEKNQLLDDDLMGETEYKDLYFIVYLDTNNKTFSVEPYDGNIFIGGEFNE